MKYRGFLRVTARCCPLCSLRLACIYVERNLSSRSDPEPSSCRDSEECTERARDALTCARKNPGILGDPMAGEDPDFTAWLRRQPCCAPHAPNGCSGPSEPHHSDAHAMGKKAHDHQAIPLCHKHHVEDWHRGTGVFKGWTKEKRREWFAAKLDEVWERYRRPGFADDCPI